MAQFDVHKNTGRHKASIPYVVIVQSSQFDQYRRRVVVPLVRASEIGRVQLPSFNLAVTIRNIKVVLHPLEIVSIPADQLGERVGSLQDHGENIVRALDELFSRAWR